MTVTVPLGSADPAPDKQSQLDSFNNRVTYLTTVIHLTNVERKGPKIGQNSLNKYLT